MKKLLLVVVAALGGLAFWRRNELRGDAERASNAVAGAATAARSKMPSSDAGTEDSADDAAEETPLVSADADATEGETSA
ncbi:MAG: hypothetical protein KUG57_00380 [Ilumatobacteraceae bacterium]|nr:hypothetical protein [Ilumatobacteraceae bacterium]